MSFTHRFTQTWGAGSNLIGPSVNVEVDSEQNLSVSIPNNTQNQPLGWDWPADKLQCIYILVSKDCTLYINDVSGGSPTDTISLVANVPFEWIRESGQPEPFTGTAGAVTSAYITVPNTDPVAACDLEARAGIDF